MSSTDVTHSKHTLAYCDHCKDEMVRCGTCDNNCCNGSSGPNPGIDTSCPDCDEAYVHQSMYWSDVNSIRFAKDVR